MSQIGRDPGAGSPGEIDDLIAVVVAHLDALAPGLDHRARAASIVADLGVRELASSVAMWERIIRFGNGFHSVARFFVDGSPEQEHILEAIGRS